MADEFAGWQNAERLSDLEEAMMDMDPNRKGEYANLFREQIMFKMSRGIPLTPEEARVAKGDDFALTMLGMAGLSGLAPLPMGPLDVSHYDPKTKTTSDFIGKHQVDKSGVEKTKLGKGWRARSLRGGIAGLVAGGGLGSAALSSSTNAAAAYAHRQNLPYHEAKRREAEKYQ